MIELVIFDWAGTTIDYGCMAPVEAFVKAFKKNGIEVDIDEVRKPMGMLKKDHIKTMLDMSRINEEFQQKKKRNYTEDDVIKINADFETELFKVLADYTKPLPHVVGVVAKLRDMDIKIGSTTGYTGAMMEIVTEKAAENGYAPDFYCTADDVGKGRPEPLMVEYNMEHFGIVNPKHVIKVGDTLVDLQEGQNADTISVATIIGSSELGLMEDEELSKEAIEKTRTTFIEAKADYVLTDIRELIPLVEKINQEG